MTITSQLITDAYRQSNLLPIGVDPTALQQAEALRLLSRITKSVLGFEVGEGLLSFPVGSTNINRPAGYPYWNNIPGGNDWFLPSNVRMVLNNDEPITINLDPNPEDGARVAVVAVSPISVNTLTLDGNGRLIDGATTTLIDANGFNGEWLYRADLASWMRVAPLTIVSEFPYPEEFDDFFITMLALRLNPAYGVTLDQQSQSVLQRSRQQLIARYNQWEEVGSEMALYRLPKMGNQRDSYMFYSDDPTTAFNRGRAWAR